MNVKYIDREGVPLKSLKELFDELSVQLMDEDTNEPLDARETIITAMTRAESMTAPAF